MTIFDRIKETSEKRGLTIAQLEKEAALKERAVYAWKKSKPSGEALAAVADVLHVSTDYLLGRTDEMNPSSKNEPSEVDIKKAIEQDIMLAFDGKPISDKYKRIIIELLSEEDD